MVKVAAEACMNELKAKYPEHFQSENATQVHLRDSVHGLFDRQTKRLE